MILIYNQMDMPSHLRRRKLTFGQKAADSITKIAGSWIFIIGFFSFLIVWMILNTAAWFHNWDSYPFILLNLVLSCLAAIQAPIILMSQNRENQRDRIKADYDYAINRKTERQIEKIKLQLDKIEKIILKFDDKCK